MLSRVSLTLRIFVVYAVFVALGGWFVIRTVLSEIKPAVRQSTEETLVDTANLLAEIVMPALRDGTLANSEFAQLLEAYAARDPRASIWDISKNTVNHRIYVTDARGIVILDSAGKAVGQDYSRWNDVYLTLRGRYGARTTEDVPGDERSTVMHVAAAVRDGERIIGVVTIAKPNRTLQPYIDKAQRHLTVLGAALIVTGLAIGAVLSWWLSLAIRRLTGYARDVSRGGRALVPHLPGGELAELARALDSMRAQLEGKAYVERYVQTLTHELKGPLSGIHGAAEVLRREMSPTERERFLDHIDTETARLQHLSERLLHLALVEQRRGLEEQVDIELQPLATELLASLATRTSAAGVTFENAIAEQTRVTGERFLVRQALLNLLDNALDFARRGGRVRIDTLPSDAAAGVAIRVWNEGEPIPDFALPRLTERFYSLPRPATGRKSTGLGLNFVQEVAALHGGGLTVSNAADGVAAVLTLPRSKTT
jgi:two-component system, OmpR family, sensor histidine kinase CreC